MLKRFAILILGLLIVFSIPNLVSAKTIVKVTSKPVATATPSPTPVDSFALFWPMSAGKTMQSKVYFLKILKEKLRGVFVFGSAQKSDYDLFIGIKRMLEAEALMKGNVPDLANKTLDSASSDFNSANDNLNKAKNSSDIDQDTKNEINTRVTNLKNFTNSLMLQYPTYKEKLQKILTDLNSLSV